MAEITRVYGSRASAEAAVKQLQMAGFSDDGIRLAPYAAQSGHFTVGVRAPFGTGQTATIILDEHRPLAAFTTYDRSPEVEQISRLSAWKSPGAISRLSARQSPGVISQLSKTTATGAIGRLSRGWFFSSLLGLPLLLRRE
jgi:hypothetical protein